MSVIITTDLTDDYGLIMAFLLKVGRPVDVLMITDLTCLSYSNPKIGLVLSNYKFDLIKSHRTSNTLLVALHKINLQAFSN